MQVKLPIKVIFTWFIIQEECKVVFFFKSKLPMLWLLLLYMYCVAQWRCSAFYMILDSERERANVFSLALRFFGSVLGRSAYQFIHHINTCKQRTLASRTYSHIFAFYHLNTGINIRVNRTTKSQFNVNLCGFSAPLCVCVATTALAELLQFSGHNAKIQFIPHACVLSLFFSFLLHSKSQSCSLFSV